MNKYCLEKIIKNEKWPEYEVLCWWNTKEMCNTPNGYIVQEVKIESNIISRAHYYEAWLVDNYNCVKNGFDFDDRFWYDNNHCLYDGWEKVLGNDTYIKYLAKVYYVSSNNKELFNYINKWKPSVIEAGELKSKYYKDAYKLHNLAPICLRNFSNTYSLKNTNEMIEIILDFLYAKNRENDSTLLNEIISKIPKNNNPETIKKQIEKRIKGDRVGKNKGIIGRTK